MFFKRNPQTNVLPVSVKISELSIAHGKEMRNIGEVEYKPRQKSLSEIIRRGLTKIFKK
jgi:hypothetical protein